MFLIKRRRSADAHYWTVYLIKVTKAAIGGVLKIVLKNFAILAILVKHLCWSLFYIKLQTLRLQGLQLYEKQTPTQTFSCEYFKIFQITYFEEHMHTATSEVTLESDCLGLSFCAVAFKIITQYYKNTCRFQTRTLNTIWCMSCL